MIVMMWLFVAIAALYACRTACSVCGLLIERHHANKAWSELRAYKERGLNK